MTMHEEHSEQEAPESAPKRARKGHPAIPDGPERKAPRPIPGFPDLDIPGRAASFRVKRWADALQAWEECGLPVNGAKRVKFEVVDPSAKQPKGAPHPDQLKILWGSGKYKLAFKTADGKLAGVRVLTVDDPAFPPKPAYAGPAAEAELASEPAAQVASSPSGPDIETQLITRLAGPDGRIAASDLMLFMSFQERQDERREARERARRQQEREDADERLKRERQEHEQAMQRQSQMWRETFRSMREAARGDDDGDDDAIDELRDEIRQIKEALTGGAKPAEGAVSLKDMVEAGMTIAQQFATPAKPAS